MPFPEDFLQDKHIIDKYFKSVTEHKEAFFDVEEFEIIIDYLIYTFDITGARDVAATASSQHPAAIALQLKKAFIQTLVGQYRKAIISLQQIIAIEAANFEAYHILAMAYSKTGKKDEAIASFQKAIELCNSEEKGQIMLDLSMEFTNVNRFDEALEILKEIVFLNPQEDFAIYELQFCLQKANRLDEGPTVLKKVIDQNPYSLAAWFNLGVCYGYMQDYQNAIESYDFALAIQEDHTPSLFNKGNTLYLLQQYEDALETYQLVIDLDDPLAITYCNMGECYEQLMEFDKALAQYDKALALDPSFADAHIGSAIAEDLRGNIAEGIAHVEKALAISPTNTDYRHFYAEMLKKAQNYDRAIEVFEESIQTAKYNLNLYLGYFDCLFTTLQDEKAMDILMMAFKNMGEQDEINIRFLALLTRQGKAQKASILLETLLTGNKSIGQKFLSYHPQAMDNKEVVELINEYNL